MRKRFFGMTSSGSAVAMFEGDSPREVKIVVNGVEAHVRESRLFRDGGTREFVTDMGNLVLPHRIGNPDRTPRWQGEKVE